MQFENNVVVLSVKMQCHGAQVSGGHRLAALQPVRRPGKRQAAYVHAHVVGDFKQHANIKYFAQLYIRK